MNKVYGILKEFTLIRGDESRLIVAYGCQPEIDGIYATWYETYFYKKQHPVVTLEEIKDVVVSEINTNTNKTIIRGFVWNGISVWLSSENQFNFKAAYDLAVQTQGASLPVKFKLGETANGEPVYHTFEDIEEFTDFYTKAIAYINKCLNEGWELKDSIDWNDYKITEA